MSFVKVWLIDLFWWIVIAIKLDFTCNIIKVEFSLLYIVFTFHGSSLIFKLLDELANIVFISFFVQFVVFGYMYLCKNQFINANLDAFILNE